MEEKVKIKDLFLNGCEIENPDDVYRLAVVVASSLGDFARKKHMSQEEARDFFVWSINSMLYEVPFDLNVELHMWSNECKPLNVAPAHLDFDDSFRKPSVEEPFWEDGKGIARIYRQEEDSYED